MPFTRPSLQQIIDRIKTDIKGELSVTTILRRSFLDVIARAVAGASHSLHGFLNFVSLQAFPDTAETEFLERWGAIYGVTRLEAVKAQLVLKFTGTPATTISAGTVLSRSDGEEYTVDASIDIQTDTVEIRTIQTRADVGGDLGGTFFLLDTPAASYYVWFDVDNGNADPGVAGRSGIEVDISSGDADTVVAAALQSVLDGVGDLSASVLGAVVTVTNDAPGTVDDADDGAAAPTGFIFTTTQQGLTGGEVEGQVTAETAGEIGNILAGESLTFVSPIAGVDSTASVVSTATEGEDTETDSRLRSRLIDRIQQPPSGGNANDYIQTALGVAGVTRAWVFPLNRGAGTVDLTFVEDDEADIIPDAGKVAEVQAAIDAFRPVTTDSIVFAPVADALDLTIKIKPNNAAVRTAVINELQDLIFRDGNPNGAFKDAGETYDGKILLSRIGEAISLAQGEEDHEIVSPVADFQPASNRIAKLGTITWQTLA